MNLTAPRPIACAFGLLVLGGCVTPVKSLVDTARIEAVKSVAVAQTMIGSVQQPILPLIDAGIARASTNGISEAIVSAEREIIDSYAHRIAQVLEGELGFTVKALAPFGESAGLTGHPPQADERYPLILAGEANYFEAEDFEDIRGVDFGPVAISLCKASDVDAIALSYSFINVMGADMIFGSSVRLDSYLYLIDKDGVLVVEGRFCSDLLRTSSSDALGFKRVLELFDTWIDKLATDIRTKMGLPEDQSPSSAPAVPGAGE